MIFLISDLLYVCLARDITTANNALSQIMRQNHRKFI